MDSGAQFGRILQAGRRETEGFEPNGPTTTVETGRPGLTILRDSFGVPFIYGTTLEDVWFGAGFATAQDRALLLMLGRDVARAIVADIPGVDPLMLLTNASSFVPSAQTEALVTAQQEKLVRGYGSKGRQKLRDLAAYADGVTAGFQQSGGLDRPWTVNDAIAITAFIGSIFGNGAHGDRQRVSRLPTAVRLPHGRSCYRSATVPRFLVLTLLPLITLAEVEHVEQVPDRGDVGRYVG